ncbi:MAG: DedA family protein [Candidatus Moranbacteria bacterium]|nr:DedA family protein [Candidatus Moranbacteria bacterium]
MDGQVIIQFLTDYGYWIILPLMIIEGPIVTILAAFMASLGIFDITTVLLLSIVGDVVGDIMLYGVGRIWGMTFVRRVGKYMGITESLVLKMEKFFEKHGGKTIFSVKSTTGLCWATWVAAGIVKMKFWRFVWYSFLGGVVWSAFLVAMGYFFGEFYERIVEGIKFAGWIVFGIGVLVIVGMNVYKKGKSEDLFEEK